MKQNNNGIIADFNDLKYVKILIRNLKEDNNLRAISETAHEYVVEQFSVENVSKQLEKALYNIMLDTKGNY
jgi:glycosyltransferase involved in cell wall biosynthesis